MITDRNTALRVTSDLIARLRGAIEPLTPDGPSPLAVAIVGALYPEGPRPGDLLTAAELRDLPPGSLIRSRFDGHILERTQHGWRFCWDEVSLSPGMREYELLLCKGDRATPRSVGGLTVGDRLTIPARAPMPGFEVEVTGFRTDDTISVRRVSP